MHTENKMGTQPMVRVLWTMGIPIIVSMILQACYNIVDSMFVSRMPDMNGLANTGEYAMNALTLAFPIQMLIVAFGIGTGVGVNALMSRTLGQGNRTKAAKAAGNGIMLGIIIYLCFLVFAVFGIRGYLKTQTSDPVILSMGTTYLAICTYLSFGNIMYGIYEKLLQSTGKTLLSTIAQIAGALTNIIFDPIMIYGLVGCPAMGVAGAAYATVLGQFVSLALDMFFHYKMNKEVPAGIRYLKLDAQTVKEIYQIGIPAIIMQALMSVMTYGVNIIFAGVSTAAVTAYGIFYKIQQFIFFAGFGLRDAITPLVAYNYGMGSYKRVKEGVRYGILDTSLIMIIGIIAMEMFAHPLAQIFGLSEHTEILCARAMRIIAPGFIFAGINISSQGIFQALEKGTYSLYVSLLRLVIVVLPLAYLFSIMKTAEFLIWFAFPIAEAVAMLAAAFLLKRTRVQKIEPMKNWGMDQNKSNRIDKKQPG
ncbi:MATE family efflux transporter [Bilifractor sp. LCP19S3_H10]|uniref:MATE family efflux transporter n=1 Tax=Bilifractor sp. LCP19S3_H10 TaxID=3438736 RepID=UPI003F93EA63